MPARHTRAGRGPQPERRRDRRPHPGGPLPASRRRGERSRRDRVARPEVPPRCRLCAVEPRRRRGRNLHALRVVPLPDGPGGAPAAAAAGRDGPRNQGRGGRRHARADPAADRPRGEAPGDRGAPRGLAARRGALHPGAAGVARAPGPGCEGRVAPRPEGCPHRLRPGRHARAAGTPLDGRGAGHRRPHVALTVRRAIPGIGRRGPPRLPHAVADHPVTFPARTPGTARGRAARGGWRSADGGRWRTRRSPPRPWPTRSGWSWRRRATGRPTCARAPR